MTDDRTDPAWGTSLEPGAPADGPLRTRLARALWTAVTAGRIATGSTLPPSRRLAAELGCSRWVVTEVYAQLAAEGYLEARSGSATRVRAEAAPAVTPPPPAPGDRPDPEFDLLPGVPDLRAFPREAWADAVRDATRSLTRTELGYPGAAGLPLLRQRLAAYLVPGRGAALDARQLVVRGGTLDAVLQMCRLLRAAGHRRVAVEDPGWTRLRTVVAAEGLVPVPVPVDGDGLRVDLLRRERQVRAVIVAPAHQFPTGVVLAPARRGDGPDGRGPAAAREAARLGVRVADLDDYRVRRGADAGPPVLVLGYGNLADPAVPCPVRRLAAAIDAAPCREA